jgi:RNA polymerase sigma-70 factor (ECF subfamily)
LVAGAAAEEGRSWEAFPAFLSRYSPPLRSYLLVRFRFDADRVDDLLQGFLADKVLGERLLRRADRRRGRFRSFLVRALDHFVTSQLRKDHAAKRSPPGGVASLDESLARIPAAPAMADVFDVAWAKRVVELAVETMRRECEKDGRHDLWHVFDARVLRPTLGMSDPLPLQELVTELGVTPAQASNLLSTAKRRFTQALRREVSAYASDEPDAEEELLRLRRILARSGGPA